MRTMPLPVSLAELFHLVRTEVKGADLTSWHSLLAKSDVGISGPPPSQQKDKLRLLRRTLCCARPHGTGPCSRYRSGQRAHGRKSGRASASEADPGEECPRLPGVSPRSWCGRSTTPSSCAMVV